VRRLRAAGCVFAEDEAALLQEAAGSAGELESLVAARVSGLPLEQVVGWADFAGLRVLVDPGVFVPRRRSEFLVGLAIALITARPRANGPQGHPPVIVDLCCGTGALGLATATALSSEALSPGELPGADLHAADLDPAAVACARRNVEPAGGHVHEGDLFEPLPAALRGRVGVLICNAPYVPAGEIRFMPPEARDHEARMALDGGADGLAVLRRVAAQAPRWLAPGGTLLVETSQRQAAAMMAAMSEAGLMARVHEDDEMGATVVTGTGATG
jgi:release factor glutamine methyltransferase